MSTITHPVLLIMAQRLASITNKTGANIRNLFQFTMLFGLKSVIAIEVVNYLFINNVYLCAYKNESLCNYLLYYTL